MPEQTNSQEVTWELGLSSPEQLRREADALDTKATGIFAAASVIFAVYPAFSSSIRIDFTLIPFVIAFLIYLFTGVQCIRAIKFAEFKGPPDPQTLRESFWALKPDEARSRLWSHIENAFKENYNLVRDKGRYLKWTAYSLGAEVIFLVIWTLLVSLIPAS